MSSSKMGLRAGDLQHLLERRQEVRRHGGNLPLKLGFEGLASNPLRFACGVTRVIVLLQTHIAE